MAGASSLSDVSNVIYSTVHFYTAAAAVDVGREGGGAPVLIRSVLRVNYCSSSELPLAAVSKW